ncbi:MAG: hypothetical protein ACI4PV_01480, partial [Butyricicoccus sp.]
RLVRDQKVAGSNPVTSTKKRPEIFGFSASFYAICTNARLWCLFLATILQPFKMYQKAARINM